MKITNILTTIILASIFAISFVSCDKEDSNIQNNENNDNLNKELLSANPINQYDMAGKLHNQYLKEIMGMNIKNYSETSYFDIAIEEFNISATVSREIREAITNENYRNDFVYTIEKNVTSRRVQNILINLFNTTRTKNDNGLYTGYTDFVNDINNFENQIIADNTLEDSSKELLLSVTSVYRHSAAYWSNYLQNQGIEANPKLSWWKWLVFGAADAVGGLLGGGAFSVGSAVSASNLAFTVLTYTPKE